MSWDCAPELSTSGPPGAQCQERRGPRHGESYTAWRTNYEEWREAGRAAFDFSAYDEDKVAWTRTSYIQAQVMLHDRFLYDRANRRWTVSRYLDDLRSRYGGIDSVLLWPFYPNAGIDARNSYDFIDSLPGGMKQLKAMVAEFHAFGVKVLWPFFPWDTGTRQMGEPSYVSMVAKVLEIGADGINGDTMQGVNRSFWEAAMGRGRALAMEPEAMASTDDALRGLETDVMSWGYWRYEQSPAIDAYKSLEMRHTTHICERWATDRTDGLHHFFFSAAGYESWENVWGAYNQLSPFHATLLKRMAVILRGLGGFTSAPSTQWSPHVPLACAKTAEELNCVREPDVFVSHFANSSEYSNRSASASQPRSSPDAETVAANSSQPLPAGESRLRRVRSGRCPDGDAAPAVRAGHALL